MNSALEWSQTMSAGTLLSIAAIAIFVILIAVMVFRLHAFLTLILVSLLTAFATGIPMENILKTLTGGFGSTLASVALLVGIGAMLGKLVEASGGAKVLADSMVNKFGEKHAPLALGVASLLVGFPIFFDAGLIIMLPIVFAVAKRLNGPVILYGIPTAAAFSVMHVFLPPHPGAVGAGVILNANLGIITVLGLIVAIPTFYLSGVVWARFISKRVNVNSPDLFAGVSDNELPNHPPSVGVIAALLLLPVLLIFMNTGLSALVKSGNLSGDAVWVKFLILIGNTPVALLIATLVAMLTLGRKITHDKTVLEKIMDSSLPTVCSVILITGAGGMFGGVLRASGIGDALSQSLSALGIPVIFAAYLIAVILRIAQGSATVALLTTASLISTVVAGGAFSDTAIACIVLAMAAGSVCASHVNDSGFWLVGRLMGMDVKTTLKVWTMQQTLESVIGFAFVYILYILFA
ncbi:GntP family permease [Suttonella ornithocola]|uniref:Inner membrane permease ygbN n=1 Tax=Suttonella ornithocola TaxID=279832 RepID=A0A380MUN3_9GAMM|nr:GntP family permease [Suttonella ornithocola]SUO95894.1 Inner membrane permease ygbN [Suttonella ornithocola]